MTRSNTTHNVRALGLPVASPLTWSTPTRLPWQMVPEGPFPARTVLQFTCVTSCHPAATATSHTITPPAPATLVLVPHLHGGSRRTPDSACPVASTPLRSLVSVVLLDPARTDDLGNREGGRS